jgi:hypothetical protein
MTQRGRALHAWHLPAHNKPVQHPDHEKVPQGLLLLLLLLPGRSHKAPCL